MSSSCTSPLLPLLFALVGVAIVLLGAFAWIRPDSKIVRFVVDHAFPSEASADPISSLLGNTLEHRSRQVLWGCRLLGPPVGGFFASVGIYISILQWHCGVWAPNLSQWFGWFEVRFWPPVLLAVLLVGTLAVLVTHGRSLATRLIATASLCLIIAAGGEAAAFHVGTQASRWFVLAMLLSVCYAVFAMLHRARRKLG